MSGKIPWNHTLKPLMLAPMQGITNRGLRNVFSEWVRPDVIFTEFIRVRPGSKKPLSQTDLLEVADKGNSVPLVAQLIGRDMQALLLAADAVQNAGVRHLNINMGCPFGRMNARSAGGALLMEPAGIEEILLALRKEVAGSLSIKMRAGYEDPMQIFSLLPLFENVGIDFLVLHPRTVKQKYAGKADHVLTRRVVASTRIPLIANGDITTTAEGCEVLESTGSAGLMLGRGAIGDPMLFERLRGKAPAEPIRDLRAAELRYYLLKILDCYRDIFCGETQVLCKMKAVVTYICESQFSTHMKVLKRCKNLAKFVDLIQGIE
jgi:tRNA-dihydrouridine synthase